MKAEIIKNMIAVHRNSGGIIEVFDIEQAENFANDLLDCAQYLRTTPDALRSCRECGQVGFHKMSCGSKGKNTFNGG